MIQFGVFYLNFIANSDIEGNVTIEIPVANRQVSTDPKSSYAY